MNRGRSAINCVFGLAVQTHKRRGIPIGHRGNAAFGATELCSSSFFKQPAGAGADFPQCAPQSGLPEAGLFIARARRSGQCTLYLTDRRDLVAIDRQIPAAWFRTRAIDQLAPSNHQIMRHAALLLAAEPIAGRKDWNAMIYE